MINSVTLKVKGFNHHYLQLGGKVDVEVNDYGDFTIVRCYTAIEAEQRKGWHWFDKHMGVAFRLCEEHVFRSEDVDEIHECEVRQ